jgi:uncharacterized membrane protein
MDAILINDDLELKVYILNVSEDVKQAHLLVTSFYGKGERAVCIADINYKFNSIFNFLTTDNYNIRLHKDYVAVIEKVSSMLCERYGEEYA